MKDSNMKKLIASALVASMLITTPAFAEHRKRDRDHSQQERRKGGCGWLCGAIIGGVVVGALSSDRKERRERDQEQEYDNRYYPPDRRIDKRYCVREQIVEWHRGERYVYWQTTCN
jgi:predicted nucleic acid-binding protein